MIWTFSDILTVGVGVLMLLLVLIWHYSFKVFMKYTKNIDNNIKNRRCSNCIYGFPQQKLAGNPLKRVSSVIICHLHPNKTTHNLYDWCGNFCP